MNIYNFFDKNILVKSLPFYIPITLGIFNKLNSIALFIIPLQAISSISKQTLSPILKELLEIFKLPIPNDSYLFIFFSLLILLTIITFIFSNIVKQFFVLRIKKKIFLTNKIKSMTNNDKIHYFTKKFEKINYYIETSENIIFCSILVLVISSIRNTSANFIVGFIKFSCVFLICLSKLSL